MEKELSEICSSILQLLDDHLIPTASSGESKVFYLKMKGDYHRYLAEFKTGTDRKDAAEHTLLAYKAAQVRLRPRQTRLQHCFRSRRTLWPRYSIGLTSNLLLRCRILPWWILLPPTPSDWVWHSTFQCSTMRSSTHQSARATWPSRYLLALLILLPGLLPGVSFPAHTVLHTCSPAEAFSPAQGKIACVC